MDSPSVEGVNVGELIGRGGCGRVFRAEGADGAALAVKVLDSMGVNRELFAQATMRLETGGWPAGVERVVSCDFLGKPLTRVTPMEADVDDDGVVRPRSVQHRLDEHPGIDSWKLVKALAKTLGEMHERQVAHGNLKPGNLMFDAEGGLLVTDWALGNMPGVGDFQFTDAVLYQAPEQLRDPLGYLEEAGYRWDVFSFGVLAYRLLTGRYPRCHETFDYVAPPQGETHRDGLRADLSKIATNLDENPDVAWPDEVRNPLEKGFRQWIDRCLALDPAKRPASMVVVSAGFDAVVADEAVEKEREHLMDLRRRAERRAWRAVFGLGAAAAIALVFGGLWQLAGSQLRGEKAKRVTEVGSLRVLADASVAAKNEAEEKGARAEQRLNYEEELWLSRLEASRQVGDRLFSWAMEKGHRRLPPLDGRELRLKRLERYFDDFLTRTADVDELSDERARIRLALAEVSLAGGDAEAAETRLGEALDAWSTLPVDADLKFRVATDSLLLALLRQERSDEGVGEAFAAAKKALGEVPRTEVDTDRLDQLLAVLDFHEARMLAADGDDTRALEQLMRATQTLNRITEQRPDTVVLRSELAACYLSSATILEGMGTLGDAREVRGLAADELVKLLKQDPGNEGVRLDLAGCYGAMAEAAVLAGDIGGADKLSAQTMKLLDGILVEQPEHAVAVSRKAAQLGLRAGIKRDRGDALGAMKDFDEGIRMLEAIRASQPGDAMVAYRLALLWWHKGRMLGMGGKRDGEVTLISKARELLGSLEAGQAAAGPSPEQLQRSTAYLLGDLGHAMQLADRDQDAKHAFSDAVSLWEGLVASRPRSEEYSEGLDWCRQRLDDMK